MRNNSLHQLIFMAMFLKIKRSDFSRFSLEVIIQYCAKVMQTIINEYRLLNVGRHFPGKGEGKDHCCTVCLEEHRRLMQGGDGGRVPHTAKTTFKCSECDVYLCIQKEQNCFRKYHTQVEFWHDAPPSDNKSSDTDDSD